MALCESQLDSALPALQRERERERNDSSPHSSSQESPEKKAKLKPNGDIYGLDQVPGGLPLAVDYRSPVSHFVPPAVEMYAARQKNEPITSTPESSGTPTPIKRKRGRPRVDKTSPEYLANLAARKQAREMAAMMSRNDGTPTGEKRKRGRPRVDKTSPEYLARKRARELEALERKAKREYRRRTTGAKTVVKTSQRHAGKVSTRIGKKIPITASNGKKGPVRKPVLRKIPVKGPKVKVPDRKVLVRRKLVKKRDSAASSSAGESTSRVKRKYTKRAPSAKKNDSTGSEKVKGKRGRPRKTDPQTGNRQGQQPKIRVRSNLMPQNNETITLDSDDEPDLGSPGQASDSLSLDENLRALRHIHEKYANIDKDDMYEAHLLAANFKKPPQEQRLRDDEDVLSIRSSEGTASVKEMETRVEKLEDSSDSDSSSSASGSSSSGSSSSSSSSSSSDSSDSETESDGEAPRNNGEQRNNASTHEDDSRSFGAWSYSGAQSDSDSDPERASDPCGPAVGSHDEISESDNESADKSFQCHICRKWYSTKVTLKIHRRGHQNRGGGGNSRSRPRASDRYECDCCSETFTRREKLWEHKAAAHRGAMTVRCEVCRKCFEDDAELTAHSATHTADERAGRCSECGASFARFDQLRRHLAVAHNVGSAATSSSSALPHACTTCGKRFGHAHSLTRHMHNHAKQLYRCVVCKASFARADQLAQHLNSHLANYKRLKP